jgi:glucose-1-phosphatase
VKGRSATGPDVVLFDLGGVLAAFGGIEPMGALSGITEPDEIWRRWLGCRWVRSFESGACSPEDFARGVVEDWKLSVSGDEFLDEFRSWLKGPLEGAEALVSEVSGHATTACFSNTNALHWEAGGAQWDLMGRFDRTFLSFQLGLLKPDAEAFVAVVGDLGVAAERVLFLDDNQINVEAARAVGLRGERVVGVEEARFALIEAGLPLSAPR